MDDWNQLVNLPDVTHVFKGARGSLYDHHGSTGNTTAYREPSNMPGTGKKLQGSSGRTLYVPSDSIEDLGRLFQNKNMATELVPSADGKLLQVKALESGSHMLTGPFKQGDVLASAPVSGKPYAGAAPVEMFGSNVSPVGSKGSGIHFGNEITEVHPKPARLNGKLALGAALLGGAEAASAGEYRKAAGDVAESFLPPWLTPSETNANNDEEMAKRWASLKRSQEASWGGEGKRGVTMPDNYAAGGRVRLI